MRNPQAADSLEGVARWRLLDETIHRSVRETDHSLHALVVRGLLRETRRPGAAPIFSLNPETLREAQRLAEEEDPERTNRHDQRSIRR